MLSLPIEIMYSTLAKQLSQPALDQHKPGYECIHIRTHTELDHSFEAHNPLQRRLLICGTTSIFRASQVLLTNTHTAIHSK